MDISEDKNQEDTKGQIRDLEKKIKISFKEGDFDKLNSTIDRLRVLEPENKLSQKILKKVQSLEEKKKKEEGYKKTKEYKKMLKTLLKEERLDDLEALAKEFQAFSPNNKESDKWLLRVERLKNKLSGSEKSNKEEDKNKKGCVILKFFKGLKNKKASETDDSIVKQEEKTNFSLNLSVSNEDKMSQKTIDSTQNNIEIKKEEKKNIVLESEHLDSKISEQQSINKTKKEKAGNIFTNIFGKKEGMTQKSIIDTIVAKTEKSKVLKDIKEPHFAKKLEQKKKTGEKINLLIFSKIFLNFAAIFIVFTAIFLYVEWVDKENKVLSIIGISENTGAKLYNSAEELEGVKLKEEKLQKDIDLYKGGYDDGALNTVESIIKSRVNWPDVFKKIEEVTESVYELNNFFKYIEYNNYSFDVNNRTIRVSGVLSDPLGRNLTKLVVLEEAFKYYPKDKNDPEDTTKPYFTGFKEFMSFSKKFDEETGRYTSSFQLSFALNQ